MTPLVTALAYAEQRGWPIFPCRSNKKPYTEHGFHDASRDREQIRDWWKRWPDALIGLPTGEAFVVLDVDVKASPTGFETLEALGWPRWFSTPTVDTPSGGSHGYFRVPNPPIRNTNGSRGRGGTRLDWRGLGGYVIAPSPGSGYRWDAVLGIDTPMADVPAALMPRTHAHVQTGSRAPQSDGLTRYAEGALDRASRAILGAPNGEQERTLNEEVFAIGTLAGGGGIPENIALPALLYIARQLTDYDPRRPWRPSEIESKVTRAFRAGFTHPRKLEARHGR